jgi:hypothetical protein
MSHLAARDWTGARELAAEYDATLASEAELYAALSRFESLDHYTAHLRRLGLVKGEVDTRAHGVGARRLMEKTGALHSFDAETGLFPNEHDSLLRRLAALGGAELAEVAFLETAPGDEGQPYILQAFTGGRVYTTSARNLGDWYDTTTVVGLLNFIARDTGRPVRYAELSTGDQIAFVVVASESGLKAASAMGLLRSISHSQAVEMGKEFEEEAIQKLIPEDVTISDILD